MPADEQMLSPTDRQPFSSVRRRCRPTNQGGGKTERTTFVRSRKVLEQLDDDHAGITEQRQLRDRAGRLVTGSSVLVTGGAGYIGSHTVRALREAGRDVVVLDSLELGRAGAVIDAPLVVGDIADRDLVTATCKDHGVTQVMHFAAYKSVGESMDQPAKYWRNDVGGTVELIEACLDADVRNVVFSSSCSPRRARCTARRQSFRSSSRSRSNRRVSTPRPRR
jgi:FlaA1/EpsC-like NDP-sugar epimerase